MPLSAKSVLDGRHSPVITNQSFMFRNTQGALSVAFAVTNHGVVLFGNASVRYVIEVGSVLFSPARLLIKHASRVPHYTGLLTPLERASLPALTYIRCGRGYHCPKRLSVVYRLQILQVSLVHAVDTLVSAMAGAPNSHFAFVRACVPL